LVPERAVVAIFAVRKYQTTSTIKDIETTDGGVHYLKAKRLQPGSAGFGL